MGKRARPWDVVRLYGHTGRYRVYSLPRGRRLYVCLDADELRMDTEARVRKIEQPQRWPDDYNLPG